MTMRADGKHARPRRKTSALALALWFCTTCAMAQAPAWDELNPEQQQILKKFEGNWETLPEQRRQRLADNAQRWSTMSPEERQRARTRHQPLHAARGHRAMSAERVAVLDATTEQQAHRPRVQSFLILTVYGAGLLAANDHRSSEQHHQTRHHQH